MTKPTNFRRELKILRKNLQRRKITDKEACEWFQERGLWVDWGATTYINSILARPDIPGRVWARIGRAAKKKEAFIQPFDILKVGQGYYRYKGWNEPPFVRVKVEIKSHTHTWTEETITDLKGKVVYTTKIGIFKAKVKK